MIIPHLRMRQNLEKCRFDLEKTWNFVITKKCEPCIHLSCLLGNSLLECCLIRLYLSLLALITKHITKSEA